MKKITWKDLNIKEKLAIGTAILAFILGWALSVAAFVVPPLGEISSGILWILGQSLLYAASVFGITGYFTAETVRMRRDMSHYLNKRLIDIEHNHIIDEENDDEELH